MWPRLAVFFLLGYLCLGRSFAYWGIPPLHLFIGEIVLAWFLLAGPKTEAGTWLWGALRNPELTRLKRAYLLFLAFGILEMFRGFVLGHPPLDAVRDLAFNYYPLYFFIGLWIGLQERDFLERFLPTAAWLNGIYGIIFVLFLSGLPWFFPGTPTEVAEVPIFGQPEYSTAILLGLLALDKNWRKTLPVMLLNGAVLIGMVIRAQWLGFTLGLALFARLSKSVKRALYGALAVLIPLFLMYITNFSIPGPESRGGTISVRDMVGRVLAPVDPDAAANLTADASFHEDTAAFRTIWWLEIWFSVHETPERALLGHGYGFPLGSLVPYLDGLPTRSPHNAFFFTLGFTGWIGVLIFSAFQLEILRLLWRVYRTTGQMFGLAFWFAEVFYSLFTPFFEVPYGAIPLYVLAGCACAPLLAAQQPAQVALPRPENYFPAPLLGEATATTKPFPSSKTVHSRHT